MDSKTPMTRPDLTLARELEAALDWWRMAGVDSDFSDDATAWLAEAPLDSPAPAGTTARATASAPVSAPKAARAAVPISPPSAPASARRDLLGDSPPADLAAFREWWMTDPALETARGFPRIAPLGSAGARLMVLIPQPEEADRERLLSGPQGRLLANILAAMGLAPSAAYLAAALPSHTPMADLAGLAAGGMDAVTAHHIDLVAPRQVIAFGSGLAPMLGAVNEQSLREINYVAGKVPLLMSETLDALMEMPRLKARFWRRWMEWSPTD
ncbi:MAG: hypothetical protein ACKO1N_09240 [Erythrobacter sp.]